MYGRIMCGALLAGVAMAGLAAGAESQTPATLGAGEVFGEMALLDSGARSASVFAKGPVVCLAVPQSRFMKLLHSEPAIAVALLKEVASRLRAVQSAAS